MSQIHEALHGFTFRDCALQLREAAGGGDSEPDDDERKEALELVQMVMPGFARLATMLADEECGAVDLDGQMAQFDDLDDEQYDVMQDYIKVLTDLRLRFVLPTPPKVSRADQGLPVPVMEMPVTEMKKPQLMRLAEVRGLHKSGTKEELIDRFFGLGDDDDFAGAASDDSDYADSKSGSGKSAAPKPAKRAKARPEPEPLPVGWKEIKHNSGPGAKRQRTWSTYEGPNGEKARSRADIESMAAGGTSTSQAWNAARPKKGQLKE